MHQSAELIAFSLTLVLQELELLAATLPDVASAERLAQDADGAAQTASSRIKLARTLLPSCQCSPEQQCMLRETINFLQQLLQEKEVILVSNPRGNVILYVTLERLCNGEESLLHDNSADTIVALISSWCDHFSFLLPNALPSKLVAAYGS